MRDEKGVSDTVEVFVNGKCMRMPRGAMIAAAFLNAGAACRVSGSGEPRTAVCGMGVCFECRANVNGMPHQRTCQVECLDGMTVETQR